VADGLLTLRAGADFARCFKLPANAGAGAVEAALEGGVVTVTIPKKPIGVAAAVVERLRAADADGVAAVEVPVSRKAVEEAAAPKAAAPVSMAAAVRKGEVAVKTKGDSVTFSFKK